MVHFTFHHYYKTTEEARRSIDDFLRLWEFNVQLLHGPESFRLEFQHSIEVDPTQPDEPRKVKRRADLDSSASELDSSNIWIEFQNYPLPPSDVSLDEGTRAMFYQYMRYCQNQSLLTNVAYFCLSMLEDKAGGRENAAKKYSISRNLLKRVSELSSRRGGRNARKAAGFAMDLSPFERLFLGDYISACKK